jgi:hypothetical protein
MGTNAWRTAHQALWSLDALLIVLAYSVLILWLPIPKTKVPVSGS